MKEIDNQEDINKNSKKIKSSSHDKNEINKKTKTTKSSINTSKKTVTNNDKKNKNTKENKENSKKNKTNENLKNNNENNETNENVVWFDNNTQENNDTFNDNSIDESESEQLIKKEEIDESKLKKIAEELKENKTSASKQEKYKKIFSNIIIAIIITIYFALLMIGSQNIPTIEYIKDLKIFIIFDLILSIILFEKSYKKDEESLFLCGIEVACVGGFTIFMLDLFSKQNEKINLYMSITIGVFVLYYLIKSIVIAIKNNRKIKEIE